MATYTYAGATFDTYESSSGGKWGVKFKAPKPNKPDQRNPDAEGASFGDEPTARKEAEAYLDGKRPAPAKK